MESLEICCDGICSVSCSLHPVYVRLESVKSYYSRSVYDSSSVVFNSFRETALWQGECLELYVSCLLVPKCHRLNRFPTNDDLKKIHAVL